MMIFVFGSNLAGRHGKGAAKYARNNLGAVYGVGEGLTGDCYALPTKDYNIKTRPLKPTKYVEPRIVNGKKRWGNQTDSGQNKMTPSNSRGHDRSLTPQGWADAMAGQWG